MWMVAVGQAKDLVLPRPTATMSLEVLGRLVGQLRQQHNF